MMMLKERTVGHARELELGPQEQLLPDDAVFFVPTSCADLDPACDNLKLLSIGIVVAAGSTELVIHELLRPNPLEWAPSAWCPSPNTLFATNVRVVVPRHAIKGRALIDRHPRGSFALAVEAEVHSAPQHAAAGAPTATAESGERLTQMALAGSDDNGDIVVAPSGQAENLRPFVLGGASIDTCQEVAAAGAQPKAATAQWIAHFAGASPVLWSSLDALRTRAAIAEERLVSLDEKIDATGKASLETYLSVKAIAEKKLMSAKQWTEKRFAERDAFVMRELTAISNKVDALNAAASARDKADAAAKVASADAEVRLARVERNVASLQQAQAQINSKVAAQLTESASRSTALDSTISSVASQIDALNDELALLSDHLAKRLTQFGRALSDLREDLDTLQLQGGAASSGTKRAATGQLVPRKLGRGSLVAELVAATDGQGVPAGGGNNGLPCSPQQPFHVQRVAKGGAPPTWVGVKPTSTPPPGQGDTYTHHQTLSTPEGQGGANVGANGAARAINQL